jgi:hypothetical protein
VTVPARLDACGLMWATVCTVQYFKGWPAVRSVLIDFAEQVTAGGGDFATQEAAGHTLQAFARRALDRE